MRKLICVVGIMVVILTACVGRHKVEKYSGTEYYDNCVFDNAAQVPDMAGLKHSLKEFYETTGIQPYVLLPGYMKTINSQEEADEYSENFFKESITEQCSILFVYYPNYEKSEMGYYSLVIGNSVDEELQDDFKEVFLEEAEKCILNYNYSMGDAVSEMFLNTAEELFN